MQLGRKPEALAKYELVKDLYGTDTPGKILLSALVNRAVLLGNCNRFEESLAETEALIAELDGNTREEAGNLLPILFFNHGIVLGRLGRSEEAITIYDQTVRRFRSSPHSSVQERVIKAAYFRAVCYGRLDRSADEIQSYDECLQVAADHAPSAWLRNMVANTMVRRGMALARIGNFQEAIAAYDEVVSRFSSPENAVDDEVAKALVNKGTALHNLQREHEAAKAFEEVLARFGDSPDPGVQAQVAEAAKRLGKEPVFAEQED